MNAELQGVDSEDRREWQVPAYEKAFALPRSREYCVVIPVLNEGKRIHSLLGRMRSLGTHEVADIIVVDGGSVDGSMSEDLLRDLRVSALLVKTGPGRLGAQLRCAYAFALDEGYAGVVTIDGNDKDDPEAIPAFLEALRSGVDVVQASRFVAGGVSENLPKSREWAIRLVHAPLLSLSSGFRWTDTTQGFRGYSRRFMTDPRVALFRDLFSGYELLAYVSHRAPKLGYRCLELPTSRRYPAEGAIPTKIRGAHGHLGLLSTLLRACLGRFDPHQEDRSAGQ